MRVGEPAAERPAVLGADGLMRDPSAVVADIGPAFFAGEGLGRAAEAIDRGGLPAASGRNGAPMDRPGWEVELGVVIGSRARYLRLRVELEIDMLGRACQRVAAAS
jgi:hypothetical protein